MSDLSAMRKLLDELALPETPEEDSEDVYETGEHGDVPPEAE